MVGQHAYRERPSRLQGFKDAADMFGHETAAGFWFVMPTGEVLCMARPSDERKHVAGKLDSDSHSSRGRSGPLRTRRPRKIIRLAPGEVKGWKRWPAFLQIACRIARASRFVIGFRQ